MLVLAMVEAVGVSLVESLALVEAWLCVVVLVNHGLSSPRLLLWLSELRAIAHAGLPIVQVLVVGKKPIILVDLGGLQHLLVRLLGFFEHALVFDGAVVFAHALVHVGLHGLLAVDQVRILYDGLAKLFAIISFLRKVVLLYRVFFSGTFHTLFDELVFAWLLFIRLVPAERSEIVERDFDLEVFCFLVSRLLVVVDLSFINEGVCGFGVVLAFNLLTLVILGLGGQRNRARV